MANTEQSITSPTPSVDDERPKPLDGAKLDELIEHFSLHDPEVQRNRLAIYERMRETCPVSHSVEHGGYSVAATYQAVYDLAHQPEKLSSFPVTVPPFGNPVPMIPIEADPPVHAKYRALVRHRFSPKIVAGMDSQIRAIVTELLDNIEGKSEVDLVKEIAIPLPMRVIFDLFLGVPREDYQWLYEQVVVMLQPDPKASEEEKQQLAGAAGLEISGYFAEMLKNLRENGYGDDLVSELDQAIVDGERLSDDEILGFCLLLVPAGFDTTASSIGRMFQMFATRPEVREGLEARIDDPKALDIAVDELVRLISPVTGLARTVSEPCAFADADLDEGDRMLLMFASANRDPAEFPDPDEFVADRKPNRHVAFGTGIHRCLGMHVARKEMTVLVEEFLRRMPDYRLDPENPPVWHTGDTWGLKSLPVIFEAKR